MKFEYTYTSNFGGAIIGMRNPLESWEKADSTFGLITWNELLDLQKEVPKVEVLQSIPGICAEIVIIGPNDLDLAKRLIAAGPEHRKFLRQIQVCVDITAPIYWWKELDTYRIGTTANSTSTMHKLTAKPITVDCFEIDDGIPLDGMIIKELEFLRTKYLETKDKFYWKKLIKTLPSSWLQTRTITMNYEIVKNICHQREGHKLSEWAQFIEWAKTLPYSEDLIF